MKLIIDIPQGLKMDFENENWTALTCAEMKDALINGTPIPDNATNGDVIKALFKPNHVERTDDNVIVENYDCNEDWLNEQYQKGGKE